jgi:lia operon protein LiaG
MKKKIFMMAMVAVLFTTKMLWAQEYTIPVENVKEGKISLENFTDDLPIEGYNGNEIIITSANIDHLMPERAKGLKAIYPSGTDNTGLGLYVEKNGNHVNILCLLPITKRGKYRIKVPENFSLKIESGCERNNNIDIQNMKNEIEIKNCQSITLKNVAGPLVLSTISGGIDVAFNNGNLDKPVSINSVSGDIDISLPAKTKADIKMKTISGTIYSDFDFQKNDDKIKQVGGTNLKYQVNGGGVDINLVSISGNIYLRKGK